MASILNVDKIRSNAGTTDGLTIDTNGYVKTPARPAFNAVRSSDLNITATGWQMINIDSVELDVGSNYNSSGYYVIPVDGVYQFNLHARFANVGAGFVAMALSDRTSGSSPTTNQTTTLFGNSYVINGSPDATYESLSTSIVKELTANTNVQPWVYSADSNYYISTVTHFSGFLVG